MAQAITVTVAAEERKQLEAICRSRSLPRGIVRRAEIILGPADGVGATELAHRHQVSRPTAALWRKRWHESGIAGLHTELRPGRPRTIDDVHIAELINAALNRKPAQATQWSVRTLAAQTGLSPTTVHRFIRLFGLQPHRTKNFKLSNDPFFVEKVRKWLARRPRYHVHYTPTYASWLNQVERRFGLITQQAIRRGSFRGGESFAWATEHC